MIKYYSSIGGLILLVILSYTLAVTPTIEAYQNFDDLQNSSQTIEELSDEIFSYQQGINLINSQIGKLSSDQEQQVNHTIQGTKLISQIHFETQNESFERIEFSGITKDLLNQLQSIDEVNLIKNTQIIKDEENCILSVLIVE